MIDMVMTEEHLFPQKELHIHSEHWHPGQKASLIQCLRWLNQLKYKGERLLHGMEKKEVEFNMNLVSPFLNY